MKKFTSAAKQIEIHTLGLDDFVLQNSASEFIEISLFAENSNEQHLIIQETETLLKIDFKIDEILENETVFRKFITKRLERASVVIKIPKDKKVTIYGENINITSKNFKNDVAIYIEKGIVKLNEIQQNIAIKLYAGNVFASLKNSNIDVKTNLGKIKIDSVFYQKEYQKTLKNNPNNFKVTTIKANIFLTTQ